jgi:hypothetical protein
MILLRLNHSEQSIIEKHWQVPAFAFWGIELALANETLKLSIRNIT